MRKMLTRAMAKPGRKTKNSVNGVSESTTARDDCTGKRGCECLSCVYAQAAHDREMARRNCCCEH